MIADAFVELQDVRRLADYDATQRFTRPAVVEFVDTAEAAFAAWQAVRGRPNANLFLAALLLNRSWRGAA